MADSDATEKMHLYAESAKCARVTAEINLGAISHNVSVLQGLAKKTGCKLMAIVKADSYGHGAVEVAKKVAASNGVDFFGVATLYEGIELRLNGITDARILVLGPSLKSEWPIYKKYNLEVIINGAHIVKEIGSFGLNCHVMLDTGMSRVGLDVVQEGESYGSSRQSYQGVMADSAAHVIKELIDNGSTLAGICTHMSTADKKYTMAQYERFASVIEACAALDIKVPMIHMENSNSLLLDLIDDATVRSLLEKYEMNGYCRSGGGIYGQRNHEELKPVITVSAQVRHLHNVDPGDAVGYDRTWVAEKKTTIGTLSLGFADGYSRGLSNKGHVTIKGKDYKIAGKVCMDMTMIDVGLDGDVEVGDRAILFGDGGQLLSEMAKGLGTTQSDITCDLKPRVHRKYVDADGGGRKS